jgi:hypothetical protein
MIIRDTETARKLFPLLGERVRVREDVTQISFWKLLGRHCLAIWCYAVLAEFYDRSS